MPGYGIVRFDKTNRTITMENWPRYADPSDSLRAVQYEGWPKTIRMEDNYGREAQAYLPELQISGMTNPVVQVIDEQTLEVVYTLRINGTSFRPWVFSEGSYTVHVGDQDNENMQTLAGLQAGPQEDATVVEVAF